MYSKNKGSQIDLITSKIERLKKAQELLDTQAITHEEYSILKKKIVNEKAVQKNVPVWAIILISTMLIFLCLIILKPNIFNFIPPLNTQETKKTNSSSDKNVEKNNELANSNQKDIVSIKEAQMTLLDAGEKKMNLYVGKPDYEEMLPYGVGAVAVYVNRVNENGQIKDLAIGFQNGVIVSVQALITKYHRNN